MSVAPASASASALAGPSADDDGWTIEQMFESVSHLSASLRNAANQCDNFVKVIARHHPSAAATAFASNAGADFLALATGAGLDANSLGHAAAGGAPGTPGRRPLTKDQKRQLRKERKANRDPSAPKRPPSAYLLFQNEIRERMRREFKDLSYSEVLGKISQAWKNLTPSEREVYQDQTTENMVRWNQEKRQHGLGDSYRPITHESDADESAAAASHELANGVASVEKAKGPGRPKKARK